MSTVLFFGRSGSGKGTQAKLLADYLKETTKKGVLYIETGGMARELGKSSSYTGKLTAEMMATGGLLPEFLPVWIWSDALVKNFTGKEHVVLDGLCRRIREAAILDSAFKFYKIENPVVILLDVSEAWARQRLVERSRKDDDLKAIENRLSWFDGNVKESIEFFRTNPSCKFYTINGERPIEKIHKDIVEKIS